MGIIFSNAQMRAWIAEFGDNANWFADTIFVDDDRGPGTFTAGIVQSNNGATWKDGQPVPPDHVVRAFTLICAIPDLLAEIAAYRGLNTPNRTGP